MKTTQKSWTYFAGWRGSFSLLILYFVLEFGTYKIGGDWGAFLYVTFHFILMPLLSMCLLIITLLYVVKASGISKKILIFSSIAIPIYIIIIAFTGNTIMVDLLNIDFNKP